LQFRTWRNIRESGGGLAEVSYHSIKDDWTYDIIFILFAAKVGVGIQS
jgi:hypothetical protein